MFSLSNSCIDCTALTNNKRTAFNTDFLYNRLNCNAAKNFKKVMLNVPV